MTVYKRKMHVMNLIKRASKKGYVSTSVIISLMWGVNINTMY